jgi:transcription elongation GreA/GreB family factor
MNSKKAIFSILAGKAEDMAMRAKEGRDEAQREANSHIGAMESRYDTFKEEAQYLAGAQQRRLQEMTAASLKIGEVANNSRLMSRSFSRVAIGCLVTLIDVDTERETCLVFSPALGGEKIQIGDQEFAVVTPESPIGKAMQGKTVDDEFSLTIAGKRQCFSVLAIE